MHTSLDIGQGVADKAASPAAVGSSGAGTAAAAAAAGKTWLQEQVSLEETQVGTL